MLILNKNIPAWSWFGIVACPEALSSLWTKRKTNTGRWSYSLKKPTPSATKSKRRLQVFWLPVHLLIASPHHPEEEWTSNICLQAVFTEKQYGCPWLSSSITLDYSRYGVLFEPWCIHLKTYSWLLSELYPVPSSNPKANPLASSICRFFHTSVTSQLAWVRLQIWSPIKHIAGSTAWLICYI